MDLVQLVQLVDQALGEPPDELMHKHDDRYAPYYHLMYLLAKAMLPKEGRLTVVELGFEVGRGAASFAAASPRVDVSSFDNTIRQQPGPAADVLARFPNITFLHSDVLPAQLDYFPPIDILHLDTIHTYAQVKAEFEAYSPGLAPGAVVMFDDLHEGGVGDFFRELPWPRLEDDRLHSRDHFLKGKLEGYGIALAP